MKPKFIKYPRMPHLEEVPEILEEEVEVYEKLDGGNSQIRKAYGRIFAGNKSNFLDEKRYNKLWFPDFLKWVMRNETFYNLPENWIVYCEWLAPHTLKYKKEAINKAYLLDIFDIEKEKFFSYERAVIELKKAGIRGINNLEPLFKGKLSFQQIKDLVLKRDSSYREPGEKMEGVVVKDYKNQRFAKLWRRSVLAKTKKIEFEDVVRGLYSLVEEGKELSLEGLIKKIASLLQEEKRRVTKKNIEEYLKENNLVDVEKLYERIRNSA